MTPNNKHHESAPWARFALVVLLGMAAFMGGVLTLEAIRTSAVAMAYAACLLLMLSATWVFLLVAPVVGAFTAVSGALRRRCRARGQGYP